MNGPVERPALSDEVFETEFESWWQSEGQYVRAGGGDYEKSFAFQAWRYLYPRTLTTSPAKSTRKSLMVNHGTYFLRGVYRIGLAAIILGLVVLMLNVGGYFLLQYDLAFIGEPTSWPASYAGRVLLLAFVGFIHFAVCIVAALICLAVLCLAFYGILFAGGYREGKK